VLKVSNDSLQQALFNLSAHDMNVKCLDRETKLPVHTLPGDTHYIMKDDEIVHVGTADSSVRFALRLPTKQENP